MFYFPSYCRDVIPTPLTNSIIFKMVIFNHQPEHSDPRNYPDNYGPNQDCAIQALWLGADRERGPHLTKCGNSHWQNGPPTKMVVSKKQRSQNSMKTHWPLGCCKMANFLGEPSPWFRYPVLGIRCVCVCPQVFNPENRSITVEKFSTEMLYDVPGRCFPMVTARGFLNCASQESIAKFGYTGFTIHPKFFPLQFVHIFSLLQNVFFRKHALLLGVKTKFCDAPTDIPQIWRGSVANCIDFGSVISPQNRRVFSLNHVNIFSEPPTRRERQSGDVGEWPHVRWCLFCSPWRIIVSVTVVYDKYNVWYMICDMI